MLIMTKGFKCDGKGIEKRHLEKVVDSTNENNEIKPTI